MLAVATAWLAAGWLWQHAPAPPAPTFAEPPDVAMAAQHIAARQWFGQPTASLPVVAEPAFEAFKLHGLIAPHTAADQTGIGLFVQSGAAPRTVRVGEEIVAGWHLHAVSRNTAIVANGKVQRRLALQRNGGMLSSPLVAHSPLPMVARSRRDD